MTRNNEPTRRERKTSLEATIEQQRVDILLAAERWQDASAPLEHGWRLIRRYRTPALTLGGFMLWPLLRRPGKALKFGRHLVFGALALKRARKLLPGRR
ncbi:YqjK-like family protein [Halomonas elongata]|uniref:YqjK-like family protein n=1 Tax=Halomonas elongata TaxID=2746 RepID=UPI000DCEF0CA|nr:YqjK-like family protein [Halomonas elongata]MBW5798650.1 YqjK-like family protein [Halomonas elongata]MDL4864169.1 YqjK-like family protein [Halomonas elongata]RAW06749.1 hypothetical protein DKQ62_12325 [Halomonas elongata]